MLLDAELVRAVDHLRVDLRLSRPAMLEVLLRWALDAEANGNGNEVGEEAEVGVEEETIHKGGGVTWMP